MPSPTINHHHGRILSITGTNPAANVEISEIVPARRRWRILSIQFALSTDATVVNRYVRLVFGDPTLTFYTSEPIQAHTASQNLNYSYGLSGLKQTFLSSAIVSPLPFLLLPAGFRFRTSTGGFQAADIFSAPQYLVEEWIDP